MAISPGGRPADASPLGKKGGPRGLTDYVREVAHALMRRGVPEGTAIAIARSQQAKWAVKSKNPAIRAASVKSLVEQHALDHRKRGHSLSIPSFASVAAGSYGSVVNPLFDSTVDLDWAQWNQEHQGQAQPAGGQQQDMLTTKAHSNIMAFQKANGLPVTGQIDAQTTAWLNNPANDVAAKAAAKKAASAATKTAAAQAKAAKAQAAAQVKAAKVAAAAAKQAASDHAAAVKLAAQQAAAQQVAATKAGRAAVSAGAPTKPRTASLSVPITTSQDGARMTGTAFGGKKAAPFVKGGGRKKPTPAELRALKNEKVKRLVASK